MRLGATHRPYDTSRELRIQPEKKPPPPNQDGKGREALKSPFLQKRYQKEDTTHHGGARHF